MKKSLSLLLLLGIVAFSCKDEGVQPVTNEFDSSIYKTSVNDQLKRKFGKAFSQALATNRDIREFVKHQSLKMMNEDYDVLYALVKNEKLGNSMTFREALLPYFINASDLDEIELKLPLITIFVPSLPEDSFSAETWNTENDIPYVAIRLQLSNDVPIISPDGEEYLLESSLIPSYPVVVIKDNERMISDKQVGFSETKSTRLLTSVDGVSYKFVDDIFDRELQLKNAYSNHRLVPESQVDQKLIDAYDTYQVNDGWQRDYIYYGITPTSPNGEFSYDFVEHIRSFKITGDAYTIYDRISDQTGDPSIKDGKKSSGWTDGAFEIRANILIQSKNGVGASVPALYLVKGKDLFDVTYNVTKKGIWPFRYDYYTIKTVTAIPQITDRPIVNWDLNNYATTLRIDVEESDNTTTYTQTTTETTKFATNFGIEGTIKKIGLKFGASLENTTTSSLVLTYTLSSEILGTALVNFADKAILSKTSIPLLGTRYYTREYDNGIFAISVEPKRVQ